MLDAAEAVDGSGGGRASGGGGASGGGSLTGGASGGGGGASGGGGGGGGGGDRRFERCRVQSEALEGQLAAQLARRTYARQLRQMHRLRAHIDPRAQVLVTMID